MPAVAGTDLYVQSSVLDAPQLRGVVATALRTGDLAFLTSTKKFYYLDKASTAADDSVNVIATKESVTINFPLGDPTIPGRWILGPCAGCGTTVTGAAQPLFVELAADDSTVANAFTSFAVPLKIISGYPAGVSLEIQADLSGDNFSVNSGVAIGVFLDNVLQRSAALTTDARGHIQSAAITLKRPVAAGPHTIELKWFAFIGGTAQCQPVTRPDTDHASLYVRQVNT